jgi:hypothetical protein
MTALLLWSIVQRGIGAIYLMAFFSLLPQLMPLAGSKGAIPFSKRLEAIHHQFGPKRWLHFPTLFWFFGASDAALYSVCICGAILSCMIIAGPLVSSPVFVAFPRVGCFLAYLSFSEAMTLLYPWDCLLFEMGFLLMFFPEPMPLFPASDSDTSSPPVFYLPSSLVVFALRFLFFRLMFGFGKFKFHGSTFSDQSYMHGFLIAQPIPSPLGWLLHHAPFICLRLGLAMLFFIEIPVPFLVFLPFFGAQFFAGSLTCAFMLVISISGNFGFFNLLTAVLGFAVVASAFSLYSSDPVDRLSLPARLALLLHSLAGASLLPLNSWVSQSALYWPSLSHWVRLSLPRSLGKTVKYLFPDPAVQLRYVFGTIHVPAGKNLATFMTAFVTTALDVLRWMQSLRLVHAYGVFPPMSLPPVRFVPVVEGSRDGRAWLEYGYRFMPSSETCRPVWVAPHCPRFDHYLLYDAVGINLSGFANNVHQPFAHYYRPNTTLLQAVLARLLVAEPGDPVLSLFGVNPFPPQKKSIQNRSEDLNYNNHNALRFLRVSTYILTANSVGDAWRSGKWWRRKYVGEHLPALATRETLRELELHQCCPNRISSSNDHAYDMSTRSMMSPVFTCMHDCGRAGLSADSLPGSLTTNTITPATTTTTRTCISTSNSNNINNIHNNNNNNNNNTKNSNENNSNPLTSPLSTAHSSLSSSSRTNLTTTALLGVAGNEAMSHRLCRARLMEWDPAITDAQAEPETFHPEMEVWLDRSTLGQWWQQQIRLINTMKQTNLIHTHTAKPTNVGLEEAEREFSEEDLGLDVSRDYLEYVSGSKGVLDTSASIIDVFFSAVMKCNVSYAFYCISAM